MYHGKKEREISLYFKNCGGCQEEEKAVFFTRVMQRKKIWPT